MTHFLPDLRTFGIALVAVAGVLSVPGTATACTAGAAAKETKSCCTGRPEAGCGCCGEAVRFSLPAEQPRVDAHGSHAHRVTRTGPCVCRSEGTPAPARAPESRPVDRPSDRLPDGAINGPAIAAPSVHLLPPARSPSGTTPDTPVYLRTARLLI